MNKFNLAWKRDWKVRGRIQHSCSKCTLPIEIWPKHSHWLLLQLQCTDFCLINHLILIAINNLTSNKQWKLIFWREMIFSTWCLRVLLGNFGKVSSLWLWYNIIESNPLWHFDQQCNCKLNQQHHNTLLLYHFSPQQLTPLIHLKFQDPGGKKNCL